MVLREAEGGQVLKLLVSVPVRDPLALAWQFLLVGADGGPVAELLRQLLQNGLFNLQEGSCGTRLVCHADFLAFTGREKLGV